MNKASAIFYSTIIAVTLIGLVYSILTKNALGVALMTFWSAFHSFALVFTLIECHRRKKRLDQEAQNRLEQFKKEN